MKPQALGLMLIASRGWLRASEARIGLGFRFQVRICHQWDLSFHLAESLGFRSQALICHQLDLSFHLAESLGFKNEKWRVYVSAPFDLQKVVCVFVSGSCVCVNHIVLELQQFDLFQVSFAGSGL